MPGPDPAPDATNASIAERTLPALQYDLDTWREQLARSIARNNLGLRSEGIATVVNQIICRFLFLRIAEDRGLVPEGTILNISRADDRYRALVMATGSLDDLWADLLPVSTPTLPAICGLKDEIAIEDSILEKLLLRLTSPERQYDFSKIATEQISDVFAVHLARTVRRSATHQAIIVDTHETVMSAAVPAPGPAVLEYLVQATLQQAMANRSRREILPLRIIDPACGPGQVLLRAFRYLTRSPPGIRKSFDERREIIADSLHGVDSSRHAVVVARILLVVSLFEGDEARIRCGTCGGLIALLCDISPQIRSAVRIGNPLIGPGIVNDESWAFCPARERHALEFYAWEPAFPEIFAAGGFDAVISNPPEGPLTEKEWIQQYFQRHYEVYDPAADLSAYFIERGLSLLRWGGALGYCMVDRWMRGKSGGPLRSFLTTKQPDEIVELQVKGDTRGDRGICILRITNRPPSHSFPVTLVSPGFSGNVAEYVAVHRFPVDPASLDAGGWAFRDTRSEMILAKIAGAGTPLDDIVMGQIHPGTRDCNARLVVINEEERAALLLHDRRAKTFMIPVINGQDLRRYQIAGSLFAIIIPRGWTDSHNHSSMNPWRWFKRRHPSVARMLKKSPGQTSSCSGKAGYWWETDACCNSGEEQSSIFLPVKFHDPSFAFCQGRAITDETTVIIRSSSLFLLGLLNSRITAFVLKNSPRRFAASDEYSWEETRDLPVYTPDLDEPADRTRHDRIVALSARMIDRQKKILQPGTDSDRGRLENDIRSIDNRINAVVYELYRLTREEIELVESRTPS